MSKKLCIMLQTTYPLSKRESDRWSAEVQADSETVRETLADHDVLEILIPVHAMQKSIFARVASCIDRIPKMEYESCHIVLNTHGSPGRSDLPDMAVKQVLQSVSSLDIPISQLSALQCNGMSALSSAEQREAAPMNSLHATARGKRSNMHMLQHKLMRSDTTRAQDFKIYGFIDAYDPINDKKDVINVLRGEGLSSLSVTILARAPRPLKTLQQISDSITIIEETEASHRIGSNQYDTAGNVLGAILDIMKTNLFAYLRKTTSLDPENEPLLRKLQDYAQQGNQALTPENAEILYKNWLKTFKIYSDERLNLFRSYLSIRFQAISDTHKRSFLQPPNQMTDNSSLPQLPNLRPQTH